MPTVGKGMALFLDEVNMRTLKRNKQKMFYSLPLSSSPIYATDDSGNIIYDRDEDGNVYPVETGEYKDGYTKPIEFKANISGQLRQTLMAEFGVVSSPNYAVLVTDKGEFKFGVGTLIWRLTKPSFDEFGNVDSGTADYSILGIIDEFLNEDTYYLHKKVK